MVYFVGDIHFSAMNSWNKEVGDKFLSYFFNHFKNEKQTNTIIFLGDIAEKDTNPGSVIEQMNSLAMFCNEHFKMTYFLMGNHDMKLYKGQLQHCLMFFNNFSNIKVIDKVEIIDIDDKQILALPHLRTTGVTLEQFYNSFDYSNYKPKSDKFDVAIGHWTAKIENNKFCEDGVDLSLIPAKNFVLGHIHNRIIPQYCGSCWPNKANEMEDSSTKYKRCIQIWNTKTDTWSEHYWPTFLFYENIEYPNKIEPIKENYVRVFTVYNIKNKQIAIDYYKDYNIKSTFSQKDLSTKNNIDKKDLNIFLFKNNKDAFASMIKEQKLSVSRQVIKIVSDLL